MKSLLVRGLLAGLLAGFVAFLVGSFVGELQVDRAIAFEEANAVPEPEASHDSHDGDATVSRTMQKGLGLLTASLGYGLAVGGLFSLVYAATAGRMGRLGHGACTASLALGGFVSIILVPFLKYPANPPAVGNPDTINTRSSYFFLFIAISVLLAVAAVLFARMLVARWDPWNAWIVAGAGYVAAVVAAGWLMPIVDDVPEDFPATLLWDFRVASLIVQATLWTTLGLAFGYLTERTTRRPAVARAKTAPCPRELA